MLVTTTVHSGANQSSKYMTLFRQLHSDLASLKLKLFSTAIVNIVKVGQVTAKPSRSISDSLSWQRCRKWHQTDHEIVIVIIIIIITTTTTTTRRMYWRRASIRDGQAPGDASPGTGFKFSAITSLFFVVDRKEEHFWNQCIFLRVSICKFSISVMLHDHFSTPFKSAWSQTLQTGKRHTFRVSAFHRYRWFGVKLFPIAVRRTVEGYLKREKCCIWIWLRPRYKIPEFFTIAPHPSSPPLLTICRRDRGDQSSLYRTQGALLVLQKIVILVLPAAAHALISV